MRGKFAVASGWVLLISYPSSALAGTFSHKGRREEELKVK